MPVWTAPVSEMTPPMSNVREIRRPADRLLVGGSFRLMVGGVLSRCSGPPA